MDRFVVGTGRCGSTLLSRMLAECSQVCSLFEFFNGLDLARRFAPGEIDGIALAGLLSAEQSVVNEMLRRGYDVPEITYPFREDGGPGRLSRSDPLPWLSVSMLPRLSDDPDSLLDRVIEWARSRPSATLDVHYRAFFEWLARRAGRPLWIERSGSSVEYLGSLAAMFPHARFLHLHRDGVEAALSMREHHAYRLAVTMLYPPEARGSAIPDAEEDPLGRILASRPPVELFGRYWSDQVVRGASAIEKIGPDRYRELRFEDLVVRPEDSLGRVAEFLELPVGGGWIGRAAGLIREIPPARAGTLTADESNRLDAVCRPGMTKLARTR